MTKIDENALAVVRAAYDADGFDGGPVSADDIRNIVTLYLAALPLTPRERGFRDAMQAARDAAARHEPPDVVAVAVIKAFEDAHTPWQPPAEETAQGREVEG